MKMIKAKVTIPEEANSRSYNPMIFGGFLEHFDNQIYGGVFDPDSPLSDEKGFRLDVIEALRELKVPVIRWPGGCFVDSYHWQTGVGETRESYGDFRWGVIEPNTFGTHEFVELCHRLGAEPYICHNGVSDPQENIDWVDYCNATEGPMAELRKKNGYPGPLNVKFWSVGNERHDKEYIGRVRDTSKAMKASDSEVQITCAGCEVDAIDNFHGIQSYLLETTGDNLDYVSIHNYWLARERNLQHYDYLTAISKSEMPDQYMTVVIKSLKESGYGNLRIAFDEWNLRAWQHPGFPRGQVDDYDSPEIKSLVEQRLEENNLASQYTMADALFSASFLNACLRHSDYVTMANIAPLVNTRGPLFVHPEGIVKRTSFHTLSMYANLLKKEVVETEVDSELLNCGTSSVSVLDAVATVDSSGKEWSIALINRDPEKSVEFSVLLKGSPVKGTFKATMLTGDSENAYNDIENPERVTPKESVIYTEDGKVVLPPHSLTIVEIA